jgi:hypothetical protein
MLFRERQQHRFGIDLMWFLFSMFCPATDCLVLSQASLIRHDFAFESRSLLSVDA